MKSKIITIAGTLGSGKSSAAKKIALETGYAHFSSGDLFRAIAAERGLSVEEINLQAELESEIDYAVDNRLRDLASQTDLVIDSRMAFHWMPNSFRVYLNLDPKVAAERIYSHLQSGERLSEDAESVEDVLASIVRRKMSEQKRYMNLYEVDVLDLTPFDLVIDTETKNLDVVTAEILKVYKKWLAH